MISLLKKPALAGFDLSLRLFREASDVVSGSSVCPIRAYKTLSSIAAEWMQPDSRLQRQM